MTILKNRNSYIVLFFLGGAIHLAISYPDFGIKTAVSVLAIGMMTKEIYNIYLRGRWYGGIGTIIDEKEDEDIFPLKMVMTTIWISGFLFFVAVMPLA